MNTMIEKLPNMILLLSGLDIPVSDLVVLWIDPELVKYLKMNSNF